MQDFMTHSIDKYYIEALRKYYIKSDDKTSKIVDFTSNQMSPFLRGSEVIECNGHDFLIVDSFGGTKPVVFNHNFFASEGCYIKFSRGIILDSQVVSYLHQLVANEDDKFESTPIGVATKRLLRRIAFYSKQGWDFNPFFYYAETLSKNLLDEAFPYLHAFGMSMLKLQTMDDEFFIERGEIVPDANKMAEHATRHPNASFSDTSAGIANIYSDSGVVHEFALHVQASYVTLLKIGLLQHEQHSINVKLRKLFEFFHEELGVFGVREAIAGCLHFAGKGGKFIPFQKGSRNIRGRLLASAWDLQLLRLPEKLIANEGPDPTSIFYVCTSDKTLQFLGQMFIVRRISSIRSGDGHIPSAVDIRYDLLKKEIGEDLLNAFLKEYSNIMSKSTLRVPANAEKMSSIAIKLEQEARDFTNI